MPYQICTLSRSTKIRPAASRWATRCTPSATRQPLCSHRPGPSRSQSKVVLASGGALVTSVTHCLTRLPSRIDQQTAPSMGKQATFNIILGAALLAAPAAHIMSRHYCASSPPSAPEKQPACCSALCTASTVCNVLPRACPHPNPARALRNSAEVGQRQPQVVSFRVVLQIPGSFRGLPRQELDEPVAVCGACLRGRDSFP